MDVTSMGGEGRVFPSTRWSLLLEADSTVARERQLGYLIESYWKPVYVYIRAVHGVPSEDAKDLTQAFFAGLLQREVLREVGPSKGRFRSLLKACLKNFLVSAHRHETRLKRGGGLARVELGDVEGLVVDPGETPDEAFDRRWTESLLTEAMAALRGALEGADRRLAYELLVARHVEATDDGRPPSYQALAERFGVPLQTVKSQIEYARLSLRSLILEQIRRYCETEEEAQRELASLF